MRYLSVCSGIEAATCAWHPLGWTPAGFSEIERFPSQVLAHHYPHVPNLGDMTRFQEWPDDLAPDLLVGGTPCQSFSVAGLRKGLADPRGNLALVYLALADRYRPEWLVWENVPGVLSSNGGRDFGAFLGGLVELGYGFAYRVLDAQFFGVAQRRRRVFVVANARDWRRAAAVLFEPHSLSGHPAPRRETGERPAPTISARPTGGGGLGTDFDLDGGLIRWPADVACTLNAAFGSKQGLEDQHALGGGNCSSLPPVAMCLNAGAMGRQDAESETLIPTFGGGFDVAHTLKGEGFDASEDGTGRGTPLVPVMAFDDPRRFNNIHGGSGEHANVLPTMESTNPKQLIAFSCKDHGADAGEVSPTLRSMGHDGSHANAGGQVAIAFSGQMSTPQVDFDMTSTLGAKNPMAIAQAMAVRRLTPRECERLQGFRDDYTLIPVGKKQAADGPRYKALGNSMAVPVMAWIGRRISEVAAQTESQPA